MKGKNVVIAVTGGIASYKAANLTSQLVQKGANVKVMMTESAQKFVTPLTFQALSRGPVYVDTFTEPEPEKIAHIDVADWADVIIIAPATANIIAKLAQGMADDFVTTSLLATKAEVYIAPAMNVHMYEHPAVQRNMAILRQDGFSFIEGEEGYLACGWVGKGRMAEAEVILDIVDKHFNRSQLLLGKKVVITAGPTQEKIDPVRYFTNHSSGKMGYALAEAAKQLGAEVTLISGPTSLEHPTGVNVVAITSAEEMYHAVDEAFTQSDILIKAAAVADYTPKNVYDQKRKKQQGEWSIEMERTVDILQTISTKKTPSQVIVGFAAESEKVVEYAKKKLEKKNLDLIVANNISEVGSGFKGDTNQITIIHRNGEMKPFPMLSKQEAAFRILEETMLYMKKVH
ncbi:bifunctional phosphopantothenoylcysteine decarboxylase/phosphopantothenate--cysteine ligase CoaBC [Halalkalibacter sp. APA_J-10(15)]|uniref:bifunctional phosphopantothenoylcysteine decarboxylase/phosphopantothenate--cysteine ligase CoaBC n=1 Tax=unclassified Halalkalibacter TaxID=2893063 RepID=UPI001FF65865|nr:bifunctional phosphopantothenoylcysteine decarboxylase/phosphopantothenate--cysteine ligase CoaBC [Halalkalibacter sp. APA_J-10(15)]MCK0470702.1 bifunctional phosphopantothenoylcysteine decarboxylase/phosphopantothenate--cysteine ligase CoaBC [Halalkalibacter sp. APA_J-10(15)]